MSSLQVTSPQSLIFPFTSPISASFPAYFPQNKPVSAFFPHFQGNGPLFQGFLGNFPAKPGNFQENRETLVKQEESPSNSEESSDFRRIFKEEAEMRLFQAFVASSWLDSFRQAKLMSPFFDNGNLLGNCLLWRELSGGCFPQKLAIASKSIEKIHGIYSKEERLRKIEYYKAKKLKWRAKHPINRGFLGRKLVAKAKPRIRGKFVKKASFFENFKEKVEDLQGN